jgi:hypothetical protein
MLCGEEPHLLSKHSNIESRLGTQLVFQVLGEPFIESDAWRATTDPMS